MAEDSEELATRLVIDASRVDPEGETLEGEVDCIDLEEEFVHPFGGIRYRLEVQVFGTEMLVRGRLEQDFSLVCSRCGQDFDDTVKVEDFTISYEIGDRNPEIDVSEDLREAVILELPQFPLCDEACPGIERKSEKIEDDRWGALDALTNPPEK